LKIIAFLLITWLQFFLINFALAQQVNIKYSVYRPINEYEIETAQKSEKVAITSAGTQVTLKVDTDINSNSTVKISDEKQVVFEHSGKNIQLEGYCQTLEENDLAFIFSAVYNGIGVPFRYAAIQNQTKPNEWQHLSLNHLGDVVDTNSVMPTEIPSSMHEVTCTGSQLSRLAPNKYTQKVELCACDFSEEYASNTIKSELMSFVPEGEITLNFHSDEVLSVNSNFAIELTSLKRNSAKFEAFVERMKAPSLPILVEHIKLKNGEFVQISDSNRSLYQNYAYSFLKVAGIWQLFYQAQQSSKGFYPILGVTKLNDSSLSIEEMCLNGCDWWGSHRQVELNFISKQLFISTIE